MTNFIGLVTKFLKNPFILLKATCWGVGLVEDYSCCDICNKKIQDVIWIEGNHAGDFYADPFITNYFGEPIVFFENYIDKENRGIISYVSVRDIKEHNNDIQKYINTALDFETHLSYPYLFVYQGELYMVPENYQSHTISAYKAGSSPAEWIKESVLVDNFDGVDTNIFEYNGLWYMFSTLRVEGNPASEGSELHIWYSDNPFSGWKKHALSPIHHNEQVARGAGYPFIIDDTLYRPTQDCTRTYGGELLIKKITKLTPEEFSEEPIKKLSGVKPFEDAFHTFSSCGNLSVIDGTRVKNSLIHSIYVTKRILKKLLSK